MVFYHNYDNCANWCQNEQHAVIIYAGSDDVQATSDIQAACDATGSVLIDIAPAPSQLLMSESHNVVAGGELRIISKDERVDFPVAWMVTMVFGDLLDVRPEVLP